jgi:hypothetical protein
MILSGCSREKEGKSAPGAQGPGEGPAIIASAEITTVNPTAEKPLVAQYSASLVQGKQVAVRFRWYVDGTLVPEAAGNMLDPGFFAKGARVEAEVVPVLDGAEARPFRTQAVTIQNTPPVVTSISLPPSPAFPGDRVAALAQGADPDRNDALTFLYEWQVDNKSVAGAEADAFDTAGLKKKSIISVTVTPFDGQDRGMPVKSPRAIVLSNRNPDITSNPPTGLESGVYVYQVAAKDPDGDAITYALAGAPQGMTINPSSGLIRWEPPKQVPGKKEISVKVSADDGDGGTAYQEFSLFLEMK